MSKGLVRAALPVAMVVAAATAVAIDTATQPTVRHASVATVPASVATVPASVTPFCDVDFCAIPDAKGTGEWVVYVTGNGHVSMFHQAYPYGIARVAS